MANNEELRCLELMPNSFLKRIARVYYVLDYLRHGHPDNPDFILDLKNTFDNKPAFVVTAAKDKARDIIVKWVPTVAKKYGFSAYTIVCIPRAKIFSSYANSQMQLLAAVSEAAKMLAGSGAADGTDAITRVADTRTTHLKETQNYKKADGTDAINSGDLPYPGITKNTCRIDKSLIAGKNIILIDDIYTPTVNIDEDCIQALYDTGAKEAVLFTLSRTV